MSSSAPLIYAELLSNIRQVSVIVALCEPCDSATKVELSENGKQFLLRHRGQLITLGLPSQAISGFQLQKPILGNKELSWRLPLAGQASRASIEGAQSNEVPWSAKDLPSDAEFTCRRCRAIIIEKGTIKVWKDLPSENWAEMMDFWHCHKPDIPASEKEADGSSSYRSYDAEKVAASKGYGASTRFLASSGIALIDITTFVLYPADCKNLTIMPASKSDSKSREATCARCQEYLGKLDNRAAGVRILKWQLSGTSSKLPYSANSLEVSPRLSFYVSSLAISAINSQCISRILLMPSIANIAVDCSTGPPSSVVPRLNCHITKPPADTPASPSKFELCSKSSSMLLLWVLMSSVTYTSSIRNKSSSLASATPTLAMKVFWRLVSTEEAAVLMDSDSVESIELPTEGILEIEGDLRESALWLPSSARKFKEWDVGLLARYQPKP
ncbi:snf2 family helicase [Diplocarpon rosae]|nr:snf2 family helicase [Diplocarpon rosae]